MERDKSLSILGLSEEASDDDIKKAYKRLALQYHPDKNQAVDAKEKFQEVNRAYQYLTNGAEGLAEYDEEDTIIVPFEVLLAMFLGKRGGGRTIFGYGPQGFTFGYSPCDFEEFDHFHHGMHGLYDSSDDSDEYYGRGLNYRNQQRRMRKKLNRKQAQERCQPPPQPNRSAETTSSKKKSKAERKKAKGDTTRTKTEENDSTSSNSTPRSETPTEADRKQQETHVPNEPEKDKGENPAGQGGRRETTPLEKPSNRSTGMGGVAKNTSEVDGKTSDSATKVTANTAQQKKKSKKQLLAEQRRRDKEMQNLADQLQKTQAEKAEREKQRQEEKRIRDEQKQREEEEQKQRELLEEQRRREQHKLEEEKRKEEQRRREEQLRQEKQLLEEQHCRQQNESSTTSSRPLNSSYMGRTKQESCVSLNGWDTVSDEEVSASEVASSISQGRSRSQTGESESASSTASPFSWGDLVEEEDVKKQKLNTERHSTRQPPAAAAGRPEKVKPQKVHRPIPGHDGTKRHPPGSSVKHKGNRVAAPVTNKSWSNYYDLLPKSEEEERVMLERALQKSQSEASPEKVAMEAQSKINDLLDMDELDDFNIPSEGRTGHQQRNSSMNAGQRGKGAKPKHGSWHSNVKAATLDNIGECDRLHPYANFPGTTHLRGGGNNRTNRGGLGTPGTSQSGISHKISGQGLNNQKQGRYSSTDDTNKENRGGLTASNNSNGSAYGSNVRSHQNDRGNLARGPPSRGYPYVNPPATHNHIVNDLPGYNRGGYYSAGNKQFPPGGAGTGQSYPRGGGGYRPNHAPNMPQNRPHSQHTGVMDDIDDVDFRSGAPNPVRPNVIHQHPYFPSGPHYAPPSMPSPSPQHRMWYNASYSSNIPQTFQAAYMTRPYYPY